MTPVEALVQRSWEARLELDYALREGRTVLARRASRGPLAVQKVLYPESGAVCHTLLLHPPGGIAGGDDLAIDIRLQDRARAVFTTPGAAKWYRSGGPQARQRVGIAVGEHAICEWLPQENIYFDSVLAANAIDVQLAPGAVFCGWDVMCLGRAARGERFLRGQVQQQLRIQAGGRPLFEERARIEGGSLILDAPAGMAGLPVCGSFLLAGMDLARPVLDACRAVAGGPECRHGLTQLPGVLIARFLGRSAEQAREYFSRLWEILRPAYAEREARRLRIWAT